MSCLGISSIPGCNMTFAAAWTGGRCPGCRTVQDGTGPPITILGFVAMVHFGGFALYWNKAKWTKKMTKLQQLHLKFGIYMKSCDRMCKRALKTHLEETKQNNLASNHPHLGSSMTWKAKDLVVVCILVWSPWESSRQHHRQPQGPPGPRGLQVQLPRQDVGSMIEWLQQNHQGLKGLPAWFSVNHPLSRELGH